MSLLTQASLVVTPNAYKEGKLYSVIPSDGSGDMSVVRATTATRVNSAGLVELVPYNYVQYSEQLDDSSWNKLNVTITPNTTIAPDGTLTADTMTNSSTGYGLWQQVSVAPSTQYTFSFYVKKGTNTSYIISVIDAISFADIATLDYSSQVGTDWVRVSTTFTTPSTTTFIRVYQMRDGSSTGTAFLWGAQFVEGSVAKDYQKTETRLNIPRLDYSNGTCPSLLVEPQRTNLALQSSSFSSSPWQSSGSFITPNTTTAPDGTLTADTLAASQVQYNWQTIAASTSTTYTMSLYVKLGTATNICLVVNNTTAWNTVGGQSFDSSDGLNTSTWTRIEFTFTTPASLPVGAINFHIGGNAETGLTQSTGTVFIWGAQLELGSYSTSYIPTTSASVTRNADVISKTGITSLIGQTEGTLFAEIYADQAGSSNNWFEIYDGTSNNWIFLGKEGIKMRGYIRTSGTTHFDNTTFTITDNAPMKVALAYKSGDYAFYINGTLIALGSSSFTINNSISIVNFGFGLATVGDSSAYKAAAIWKTRLTNTQLVQLTTI